MAFLYSLPKKARSYQEKGEQIRDIQVERALEHFSGLTPKQEKVIRSMANSIVNHLLHVPIINLKEYANTSQGHLYTEILQNLFDLNVNDVKEGERPKLMVNKSQAQVYHRRAK